ncbi:MAG: DUF4249 family protein [Bacteroidota bacterium]
MKHHLIIWVGLICLFAAGAGCQKRLDIAIAAEQELVLGGLFWADSIWAVSVLASENLLADEASISPVYGARVHISGSDGETTLLTLDSTRYNIYFDREPGVDTLYFFTSDKMPPKAGAQYSIIVEADGFPTLTAFNLVPVKPQVLAADVGAARLSPDDPTQVSSPSEADFTLTLVDPPSMRNYYQISAYIPFDRTDPVSGETSSRLVRVPYTTLDNSAFLVRGTPLVDYVYTDESFDGQEKSLRLTLKYPFELDDLADKELRIEVLSLSEAYYNAILSFQQGQVSNDLALTGITAFFSEPLPTFSNVEGGYGVFAGASRQQFILPIK